jgi:hypothetical protein
MANDHAFLVHLYRLLDGHAARGMSPSVIKDDATAFLCPALRVVL